MKKLPAIVFLLFLCCTNAQNNNIWASYYSYNNIQDMSQSSTRVFAAAEVAMFSKNMATNELKTITSVDGLKSETITALHYSSAYNKTLVGNDNGLLIVINSDNSIQNVIDIIQETTVPSNIKRINHIYEYEGKAYISCDFGIAVFNLATNEFGDTYYLGPGGAEVRVTQATVNEGRIYAATAYNGIRSASLSNPNLNDFNQWSEDTPWAWAGVATINNMLYAANASGTVFRRQNGSYAFFAQLPLAVTDFRVANGYLLVTCPSRVIVYNAQGQQVVQINQIPQADVPVTFTRASMVGETLFIGTKERGVYSAPLSSLLFEKITPDGPERNKVFSLEKTNKYLWAVYGDYSGEYDPYPLESFGVSRFSERGWETIPNEDVFGAQSISDIEANPSNEKQVYAASYHNGLIKINDGVPEILYDQNNTGTTGLQSLIDPAAPSYRSVRVNSLTFDATGNLWMTNAMVEKPLKVLKAGNQWVSYSFSDAISNAQNEQYGKMAIDRNGTKWLPSRHNGIIGFNEALDNKFIIINGENANMPSPFARSVAIDNNNRLWIGTERGLRVLPSVDRFLTDDVLNANSIIIMEDGLAQELMYEQAVMDIAVDGGNNKWLGTAGAGAYLVSPDGQTTIHHFTKQNSPLPSNSIIDIEIDPVSGDVYFATDKGLVAFKGTSTKAADDLSKVYVFPNPVRPGFDGDVNISGLTDDANVKITDIEGNLVYETTSEGGTVLWDTKAFGRHKVASGVYMIFIASEDGTQTKVKKVMIIR